MSDINEIDKIQCVFDQFGTLNVMVYSYDHNYKTINVSFAFEKKSRLPQECFSNKIWEKMIHPDDRKKVNDWKKKVIGNHLTDKLQYRIILPDNDIRWIEDHISPVNSSDHQFIGLILDITERKTIEQKYQYLAFHDTLTGLPNRNMFNDYINNFFSKDTNMEIAVMFIDLDNFKLVNDTLGHDIGDLVLKYVSERLTQCIRGGDSIYRQGGDEFIILLKRTNQSLSEKIAKRILSRISQPFSVSDKTIHITASIGISFYPSHAKDIETLIKYADEAMYKAKNSGPKRYEVYHQ